MPKYYLDTEEKPSSQPFVRLSLLIISIFANCSDNINIPVTHPTTTISKQNHSNPLANALAKVGIYQVKMRTEILQEMKADLGIFDYQKEIYHDKTTTISIVTNTEAEISDPESDSKAALISKLKPKDAVLEQKFNIDQNDKVSVAFNQNMLPSLAFDTKGGIIELSVDKNNEIVFSIIKKIESYKQQMAENSLYFGLEVRYKPYNFNSSYFERIDRENQINYIILELIDLVKDHKSIFNDNSEDHAY